MNGKRCKDCKWWDRSDIDQWLSRGNGKEYRACVRQNQSGFKFYSATSEVIYTDPDFGCVQFESK
jgi:hypothetical protein